MARARVPAGTKLSERRRSQILDAAVALWSQRGFAATSTEAIARRARLAKGTVFLYFPTKEALLAEAIQRYTLVPAAEALKRELGGQPLERSIPRLVENAWLRLREQAPLVGLVFAELRTRPREARAFLESVVLPTNRWIADALTAAMQSGEARELDARVAARALVGMVLIFVLTQEVLGGHRLTPIADDAITQTISSLFLHGILRPETRPACPS